MKPINKLLQLLAATATLTLSVSVFADEGNGVGPNIPRAVKGEQCVEDTDEMRRNHMQYLLKHRDETLREGVRTKQYSLKQCIECHVPSDDAPAASRTEGEHFCKNCHVYTGVTIDCFECHATKPQKSAKFHPLVTPRMQALEGVHQPDSGDMLNEIAESQSQTGGVSQ
ncbi:MAG: hypothetical protein OEZ16_12690 [Chromatiales bacterium]|nr:hypothetical protein [Chromatiales bacterium]